MTRAESYLKKITSLPCPPREAKLSGGFRFPQQAAGISSASLKRADVRKISTVEIFLLMRYNFAAMSPAGSESKRRVPLPAASGRHIPRFVETRRWKKNFYGRNFSTDAL
jgi:hypothetical protein